MALPAATEAYENLLGIIPPVELVYDIAGAADEPRGRLFVMSKSAGGVYQVSIKRL